MKKKKMSKNMLLLTAIFIVTIIMEIGYASIEEITGEIDGKVTANAQEGIIITDVENVSNIDANMENSKIKNFVKTTMQSTIELSSTNPLSSITYKIIVYNASTEMGRFTEVKYDKEFYDNEDITFEITEFVPGERIQPKETKNILITFRYKDTTTVPENRVLNSYLNFNVEKVNIIIAEPYLPTGFTQVEETSLETGLTIQDSKGNQYVWVEVPQSEEVYPTAGLDIDKFTDEEYTLIEKDLHTYTSEYREEGYEDEYYSDAATGLISDQYYELKKKMLKSIYQNGGFYVGKYETGIEDAPRTANSKVLTERPVIKPNVYPYNYVTCSQAQTLASGMESGNYTSSLMFGVQWDLVLKYLESKGIFQDDLKKESTLWGNYKNNLWNITSKNLKWSILKNDKENTMVWNTGVYEKSDSEQKILLSTGASENFCKQGIYDFAGNVWEWTLEKTSQTSAPCDYRGGGYKGDGFLYPAYIRLNRTNSGYSDLGFRIVI